MKLGAFALDYDGTIASHDTMDPAVRAAIGEVRDRGIVVALVTGRRLTDLRRVAGDLACFDVIVGENGAVLEFPASGRHARLSPAPSAAFLHALERRGVHYDAGESVVEADAGRAFDVLAAIRELELPLTIAFNSGRLMVLPPAVAKSTGLRQALRALRVSVHNTLGIGNAENDHDLLDACEVGAAVSWGSRALQAAADEVVEGTGPSAVADYIRRVAAQPRLTAAQMGRRRLFLGHQHDGTPVSLAVRGRTMLIAGEPGSGKSWLAGLVCEQLILQGYCVCVVDPEGDYRTLEALPAVIVLGGDDPPPGAREIGRALQHPDVSVVIDLSKLSHSDKLEYVATLMPLLAAMRRQTGLPHKILLDEAHYFLARTAHTRLIDPALAGYIVVTYRLSAVDPALRVSGDTVTFVTKEGDPPEAAALHAMCSPLPDEDAFARLLRELQPGEAALLPGAAEAGGTLRRFQMTPRLTAHVRHRSKYADMPVLEAQAFVFSDGGPGPRARTLRELTAMLETLPAERLRGHLRRHDFSRWMNDVFRDHPLAARMRAIESSVGHARDAAAQIGQAIRARYDFGE